MSVKSKLVLYPTLLVAGVVMAAFYLSGRTEVDSRCREDCEEVTAQVQFSGSPRQVPVIATLHAPGYELEPARLRNTPWLATVKVRKGDRVSLLVEQTTPGSVTCDLKHNGTLVAQKEFSGPGTTSCQYVVR